MNEGIERFGDLTDRAQDWLARYCDPATSAAAQLVWQDGTVEVPTVTFFGAFDCGKSSLLRRLLVDDDIAVPDWLTISARHETFSASDIRYRGANLRDTPGVDPGASDARGTNNTATALAAIRTTDVLVVVVTSQLLTGERELIASVMEQPWPAGSLWFVISRFDEAGVDPDGDLAGYRELVERKTRELADELERTLGRAPSVRVFTAAPDPYGIAGRDQHPDRMMWDPFRQWDGMDLLADALAGVSVDAVILRRATTARFWLTEVRVQLALQSAQADDAAGAERTTHELKMRLDQFEDRLRELRASARNDLDAAVGAVIDQALISAVLTDDSLRTRLTEALERWLERQATEFDALVQDLDDQLDHQVQRPSWERLQILLDSMAIGLETTDDESGENSDREAREYKRRLLGINKDLAKATSNLKGIIEAKPGGARRSTARAANGAPSGSSSTNSPTSPQPARSANVTGSPFTRHGLLKGLEIATTVGPVLIEFADLVRDYRSDAARAKEAIRQRERIETRLNELKVAATSAVFREFASACDTFDAELRDRSEHVAAVLAAVAEARELWDPAKHEAAQLFAAATQLG